MNSRKGEIWEVWPNDPNCSFIFVVVDMVDGVHFVLPLTSNRDSQFWGEGELPWEKHGLYKRIA